MSDIKQIHKPIHNTCNEWKQIKYSTIYRKVIRYIEIGQLQKSNREQDR